MSGFIENEQFRKLLLAFPAKAIAFLYDQYYQSLIGIARKLTHDQKTSEDIVQETFVHVWENHKQLGQFHERSIEYYLVRVVKNKAISRYKRTLQLNERKIEFTNGYTFHSNDPSIEDKIIRIEINQEIRQFIITFPRRERECLLLKLDEEMTTGQIADRLKVSKKAVERSITSANKRLKKYWSNKN
ncbi:MAG TPA: sigma-70 family RNA polymerase sigma factor [Cyclobacteriaceae bacterium]|jgi:RNA polymerase sigma-70 factor (ECF subfamily)|nr:sigma-70 family RNA polymerase sigma factor [Cyclobacteriaceae bacterium]